MRRKVVGRPRDIIECVLFPFEEAVLREAMTETHALSEVFRTLKRRKDPSDISLHCLLDKGQRYVAI